ncbi:unnamed protein product [Phytophthora fragariaefolia]|uniref:Unnamed protein product n=1 Tax=Phytophthora fragariaefolia TaxID=1490495 RepID=A0A9W6TWI2_9STRA|nr:unnamed protein product [Phytophthora fragariaefolia]
MASLDTLTRCRVRGEVVEALRCFYAASSALTADEAVRIAAKWGASHAFPVAGDDADASDLQEKMRRLNVALLDAVDRLQLDERGEMAPEAQLLLSFTQRERLKKQVQQSKTMLALIEQLTEMDRLLADVDEAVDQQRFVAAAERVAEVERLVRELADAEQPEGRDADDKKIIRVVKMQLLRKKNRLLSQLARYFACTAVWKDGSVKVTPGYVENEFETSSLSTEERRSDFWKACEVLEILTPKLKEVAKAVSQHLIKPMLQMSLSSVQQTRDESGVTLKIMPKSADAGDSSTENEVEGKCANVVSVLQFVYTELFAGNAELMNQLGDFMWKIPGNLEAQLMNVLQDEIPQDATALDAYRDVLMTAVSLPNCRHNSADTIKTDHDLCISRLRGSKTRWWLSDSRRAAIVSCEDLWISLTSTLFFTLVPNGAFPLTLLNVLPRLHSKKRRQVILSTGRDLMRQGYHDSVKITGATEKCSLNSTFGFGGKGKSGKGDTGSSAPLNGSSTADMESSCFQIPDYRVTACAHEVVELVHATLLEACTTGAASAKLLFQTSRDLLFLFRTIVPTLYEDDIANDPRACMLYHNDCLYITYHMLVVGHLYKHRLPAPLNQTATMIDMVPSFREAGERALTSYSSVQLDEVTSGMKALPSLGALDSEYDMEHVENFLKSTLYKLNGISSSWQDGLPSAVYNKVMSRMVEPLVKKFVDEILNQSVRAIVVLSSA